MIIEDYNIGRTLSIIKRWDSYFTNREPENIMGKGCLKEILVALFNLDSEEPIPTEIEKMLKEYELI